MTATVSRPASFIDGLRRSAALQKQANRAAAYRHPHLYRLPSPLVVRAQDRQIDVTTHENIYHPQVTLPFQHARNFTSRHHHGSISN